MSESVNIKPDKRMVFSAGAQASFLETTRKRLDLSWLGLSKKLKVHKRTLNDWKREQYSMPLRIVLLLARETGVPIPSEVELRDRYWHTVDAGIAGGHTTWKKYGRVGGYEAYRKKKWYEWWEHEGRYKSTICLVKPIKKPRPSKELAEFMGILMGDGGITKKQVTVTLHRYDDKLYVLYVIQLIRKLFSVNPSVFNKDSKSVTNIVVSRTKLVEFCHELGLKIGNKIKQNFDIPDWIKENQAFQIPCMRGLMDTDGCIFQETHKINGRTYSYPRLAFTSNSAPLRLSVMGIFKRFGFNPKIRTKRNVQLENRTEIIRYFRMIGTRNPKHRQRFEKFIGGVG